MGDDASSGDKLSKNELKRRQKAAQKAAEKEKKAAELAAKEKDNPKAKAAAGASKINEEEISPNEYFKLR